MGPIMLNSCSWLCHRYDEMNIDWLQMISRKISTERNKHVFGECGICFSLAVSKIDNNQFVTKKLSKRVFVNEFQPSAPPFHSRRRGKRGERERERERVACYSWMKMNESKYFDNGWQCGKKARISTPTHFIRLFVCCDYITLSFNSLTLS